MLSGHLSSENVHSNLFQSRHYLLPAGLCVLVQPGLDGVELATTAPVVSLNVHCGLELYSEVNDEVLGLFVGEWLESSHNVQ